MKRTPATESPKGRASTRPLSRTDNIPAVLLIIIFGLASFPLPAAHADDDYAPRMAGNATAPAWRIEISKPGIYRLDYATLQAHGITGITGQSLRLFNGSNEIPRRVSRNDTWQAGDYLLFYGTGHDGYYSRTNVYWLQTGGTGRTLSAQSASPLGGLPNTTTYTAQFQYDDDALFRPYYRPWDDSIDHWFAAYLSNTATNRIYMASDPELVRAGTAELQLTLHGLTTQPTVNPDHQTRVRINGTVIGDLQYDGQATFTGTLQFNADILTHGTQLIELFQVAPPALPGGTDRAYLESMVLSYPRQLSAAADVRMFNHVAAPHNYQVTGFTDDEILAFDISNPLQPTRLTGLQVQSGSGTHDVRLRFGITNDQATTLYTCTQHAVEPVQHLERVYYRMLSDTNRQADYIVICPYAFRDGVYRLLKRRYLQGLNVCVAPVTDIYNEFNYGIKDDDALRRFLGCAFHHWQAPAPRYVLLAGRGTYDPQNHLNTADHHDWIPVHLGPGPFEWACQDNWYAVVSDDDRVPDMAIGRIPVDSEADLQTVINKMEIYEAASSQAAWRRKAALCADKHDDEFNFSSASDQYVQAFLTPAGFQISKVYLEQTSLQQARQALAAALSQGVGIVSYFGHGAMDFWSQEKLLTAADFAALNYSVYPIFAALTCANADFDDPTGQCLGQVLLEEPNGGGIACIAAASLPIERASEAFSAGLFEAFQFPATHPRAGDLVMSAWEQLNTEIPASTELLFYNLLGDPALKVQFDE